MSQAIDPLVKQNTVTSCGKTPLLQARTLKGRSSPRERPQIPHSHLPKVDRSHIQVNQMQTLGFQFFFTNHIVK